jgi:hypothetical protein
MVIISNTFKVLTFKEKMVEFEVDELMTWNFWLSLLIFYASMLSSRVFSTVIFKVMESLKALLRSKTTLTHGGLAGQEFCIRTNLPHGEEL